MGPRYNKTKKLHNNKTTTTTTTTTNIKKEKQIRDKRKVSMKSPFYTIFSFLKAKCNQTCSIF